MTLTAQEIYLTKRACIHIDENEGAVTSTAFMATMNRNLETLGYTVSRQLFEALIALPQEQVTTLYREIVPILKRMTGAHRQFNPMYPNFPAQVMDASDLELYINALSHYWGSCVSDTLQVPIRILPEYQKLERSDLPDQDIHLKVIHLGTQEGFNDIFTALVGSNTSLSQDDKDIVGWFVKDRFSADLLPPVIPQKENLALVTGLVLGEGADSSAMLPLIKTATDVLRVATVMSGGDVSLSDSTKFRKWSRKERRFFLDAMERCNQLTEDMIRHRENWKRLGHGLHPFEYKNRYPKTCAAFDVVFGDKSFETFASKVEKGIGERRLVGKDSVVKLLQERPGDFARRLDHLLRLSEPVHRIYVARDFFEVASNVSTPVLMQVFNHFKNRNTHPGPRAFFPKGSVGKVQVSDVALPALPESLTNYIATNVRNTMIDRFRALPSLGKVYVDDSLRDQIVPFAQRSASKSLRTIARGSRLNLPDSPTIRFFLWWKDGMGRTDIDLSAVFHDSDWKRLADVSYYNLRTTGCYHSGDITSAPKGACEFIDIDMDAVRKNGIRYITMCLYSFTQQPYCDLPECFAGWMARSAPKSGEIFDARTVRDKIDLASDTTVSIPVIIDVTTCQVIWADISLTSSNFVNNSRSNSDNVSRMGRALASLNKPNLHDLFTMHAEARGTLVQNSHEADAVFSLYEGVTPFDIDKIMSEYMPDASKDVVMAR